MTTTETRRRGPRPSRATQPQFRRLDPKAITLATRTETLASLGQIDDLRERRTAALQILADADRALPRLRARRNRLAASAALYDRIRGVNHAAGVNRTSMVHIKQAALGGRPIPLKGDTESVDHEESARLAQENGLEHIEGAITKLPAVAEKVLRLTAAAEAARQVRDETTAALIERGEERKTDAAAAIGRTAAIITRILSQED